MFTMNSILDRQETRYDISDMIITGDPEETGTAIESFLDNTPEWFLDADLGGSNLDLIWSRHIYTTRSTGGKGGADYFPK